MNIASEQEIQHIGETQGSPNHDHDMLQELNRRLDSIWRYDQYIANAEADEGLQDLWRRCKEQDLQMVKDLKDKVAEHVSKGCF